MGLREILTAWRKQNCWFDSSELTAVLHTSCVNYSPEDLRYLERMGVRWCIPDNVRVELSMLCGCPGNYGSNAAVILRNAERSGLAGRMADGETIWDLERLYRNCAQKVQPDEICYGTMLFLFGDLAKQHEFLEHAVSLPGHYVLVGGDRSWNCVSGWGGRICSLSAEQDTLAQAARNFWSGPRVRPVGNTIGRNPMKELRRIEFFYGNGEYVKEGFHPSGMYRETDMSGTYGNIYTYSQFPGMLLKIYKKDAALRGNDVSKMNALAACARDLRHLAVAMPEWLMLDRDEDHLLIGYGMKVLRGKPLRYYYHNAWENIREPEEVLRDLARILVELHCRHILVNDLSYNNVLVDESGRVGLVDCDSFQYCDFPGGCITEIYRHPQVCAAECQACLRQPRHEYFAFAILLYQCIMLCDPLLCRGADPDMTPNWENREFPLEWDARHTEKVNCSVLEWWKSQDDAFRRAFADIFHFRADYSIGALMRELGLV